ncbi:hypothetical protein SDC9_152029 [bioreactor metagenome]|uniref:Uncharacterized protein n=1 Tax=bioreactor metagenome TaxID=1076179 RepID=A0A645EU85_9ZZZZ
MGVDVHALEEVVDDFLACGKAGIEVDGTDQRLHGIGQDGRALLATGLGFALTQAQQIRQLQLQRNLVQRAFLDEIGPNTREIAFGHGSQLGIEQAGDGQTEHRVAQKLQSLVVVGRKAAVRDGTLQQRRVGKLMLQPLLQSD